MIFGNLIYQLINGNLLKLKIKMEFSLYAEVDILAKYIKISWLYLEECMKLQKN